MITNKTPVYLVDTGNDIDIGIKPDVVVSSHLTLNQDHKFIYRSHSSKENVNELALGYQEHFKIAIGKSLIAPNLNPAIITCLAYSIQINDNMIKANQKRILIDEDRIKLVVNRKEFIFVDERPNNLILYSPQVTEKFYIGNALGSGCNGTVREAHNIETLEPLAIKVISKIQHKVQIKNEVNVMNKLRHPNILRLMQTIVGPENVFLFVEFMDVGDLLHYMKAKPQKCLSESDAKYAMHQMCEGLNFLHQNNIAHLDIKMDNIFIKSTGGMLLFKIGDFGFSVLDVNLQLPTCGTKAYCSPELFGPHHKPYSGKKRDIWALGVVMYCILSGTFPFNYRRTDFSQKISKPELNFTSNKWLNVSTRSHRLIKRMIAVDPDERLTTAEVLVHPWFTDTALKVKLNSLKKLLRPVSSKRVKSEIKPAAASILLRRM